MSRLNWINPKDYTFDHMLLLDRFQIRMMLGIPMADYCRDLGIALKHNPNVAWVFARRCPEYAEKVRKLVTSAPETDAAGIREAELRLINVHEDFMMFTTPERMDAQSDYIYSWDKNRLLELTDFCGKTVLDVGSGSGRLAFAAAKLAAWVYASEPVGMLREYMRDKIRREAIQNIRVVDGMCDNLPYPDNAFDIVMSGHVVGDHPKEELAELERVVKPGGWLLDCPGDQPRETAPNRVLLECGWEELSYEGAFGLTTYRYRKQITL